MIYPSENLNGLIALISRIKTKNFSIETQYKFIKLAKIMEEELAIVNEQKYLLLDNYAEKDEKGRFIMLDDGGVKIKEEFLGECTEKINELNERQITIPDIKVSLDELEPLELTLEELFILEPLIK